MESDKKNNLGIVRFFLAFMVFVAHFFELSQITDVAYLSHWVHSVLAVQLFFMLSGFFSVSSFERSPSSVIFFKKRFFRIYPAYALVVISSFLCFSFISTLGLASYFQSSVSWKYVSSNLIFANFLAPVLPGVFESNFLPYVNGSLWTLKIEVAYFLIVPAIMWARHRFSKWWISLALLVISIAYTYCIEKMAGGNDALIKQLPGQLHWFAFGLLAYDLRDKIVELNTAFCFAVIAVLFTLHYWWEPAYYIGAAALVFAVGFKLPFFKNSDWLGNVSYSMYLIHFPIIQFAVAMEWLRNDHGFSLLSCLCVIILLSYLIFRGVEQPQILKGKK
ncbi:MAG: acyltransferase [Cytophagaceae bacterium]|nr:acyltransferase [Cytophagaceae bacterium]